MLVGREREQRLLGGLLDDARSGRSAALALVGEAGMGKSVLLDQVAARADGMHVLRARGIQSEAHIPFAGLFELLRPALDHLDRIAPPQRRALEGAFALRPAKAPDEQSDMGAARFAIGAATLNLLAAYAETAPLLVLVDDAHWIDGSSADALLFAVRRLLADPIGVVFAVRDGEASLIDDSDVAVHVLEGLDRVATAELAGRHNVAGPMADDVIDRLHRWTGGNPLALVELAADPAAHVPPGPLDPLDPPVPVMTTVARAYADRAASLPARVRHVLLIAAASDSGELALVARVAALVGLDVDDLALAEAAGLAAVVGDRPERPWERTGRVEFRHPLARSAVYAGAPPDRRRAVHRALAGALPDAESDRRAWHLSLATVDPDDAASSALAQAAQRARSRSAYDVASLAFERAADLAPERARGAGLHQAAADSAWLAGSPVRAVELLEKAGRHASGPTAVVAVEHLRGHIACRVGPVAEGQRILLAGAELAAGVDPERAVVMLAEAVNAAFYAGDAVAMASAAARIGDLAASECRDRTGFFAAIAQGMALIFSGEGDERGAALVREAVALVGASDELADDPRLLAWAAMGPLWLRESGAGRELVDRALAVARQRSAVGVLPFLLSHIAVDGMATDRWDEAEAGFHEAIALARETGQRTDLGFSLARLAWLEARRGQEEACRAHVAEARSLAADLGLGLTEIWSHAALADLELGLGALDAARAQFEGVQAALQARGVGDVDLSPEPELVDVHLRLGRADLARSCLEVFERRAAAKGQPWSLARAARGRGLLADDDGFAAPFAEALDLHAQTPDVFETARTRLAYGARLRRARQRTRAREELRAALADFDRLGATPWSDRARVELGATGETARRRVPSTRDQLTPQELQIALLLGAGKTTREAAAMLFLSPKTIEYHLRSIYRKLGINTRAQLAARINRTAG